MIAWDIEKNKRVHASFPIECPIDELLMFLEQDTSEENWEEIRCSVEKVIEAYSGQVEIRDSDVLFEKSVLRKTLPSSEVKEQLGKGVEFTMEQSQIAKWLKV